MPGQKQYLKFEAIVPICGGERGCALQSDGPDAQGRNAFLDGGFVLTRLSTAYKRRALQRQAVSNASVGTEHPAALFFKFCRAPTSTNAAQTLSL
jgi:hypothetical protein